jgi:DNA (cytosine-5)-methyltransferase 1
MNKLKLLDLFSGIGGFSLGLESTGYFQTIAFVEKDKFCRQVLQKNFNNIPIEEDIRNVRGSNYAADVITGGFPCQPFSVAGKRKGTDDDRYLWDETIRVVAECKPRWFIGENVEGLININNGMVLRQVQTDLEEQGFQVQCIVIPASGIGAWHQRKRIWIVAYSHNNGSYRSQRNETEQSCNKQEDRLSFRDDKDVPNTDTGFGIRENQKIQTRGNTIVNGSEDVSNSNSIRHGGWSSEGCTDREWSFLQREQEGCEMGSEIKGCDRNVFNTNNKRCEELNTSKKSNKQGFNSGEFNSTETIKTWWQTQSEFCGVPNGISYELDKDRSNRIKSLGNSIVPQIARQIGLSIMKAELN